MPTMLIALFLVFSFSICTFTYASGALPSSTPTAANTAVASTDASPVAGAPTNTPTRVDPPLKSEEKKSLLAKFRKTVSDQEKNLDKEQRNSLKDFSTAQSQQLKDWRNQEKKARQIFFDQHLSGPDRRTYVQSYIGRKKDFDQKQKDDAVAFKQAQKDKHEAFKNHLKDRQIQFQSAIDHNTRPVEALWAP